MNERSVPTIQLIGDSIARRFGFFLNRIPQTSRHLSVTADFSGLTIGGLKDLVKRSTVKLSSRHLVLMFIGTNDVLARLGADSITVKQQFKSLVRLLRRRFPGILLTILQVPDFPKIQQNPPAFAAVAFLNKCMKGFHALDTLVLRIAVPLADTKFFCKCYGSSSRRDGIHFNDWANAGIQDLVILCLSTIS